MALFLAVASLRGLGALVALDVPWPSIHGRSMWFYIDRDLGFVDHAALIALAAVYPKRPPLRSWHGAVLGLASAILVWGLFGWFFARDLLYSQWPAALDGQTVLNRLAVYEGRSLAAVLLLASMLVRLRRAPLEVQRGGWVVLTALLAGNIVSSARFLTEFALDASGLVPGAFGLWAVLGGYEQDCCHIVHGLSVVILAVGLAVPAYAWRAGYRVPAAFTALGVLGAFAVFAPPLAVAGSAAVLANLLIVHAVARRGALGGVRLPPGAWDALAGAAFFTVLAAVLYAVVQTTQDPFGVSIGLVLGTGAGLALAGAVVPADRGLAALLRGSRADAEHAAPVYRAALEAELDAGLEGPALAAKLRPLRAQLGLSDREHVVMEVTLRAARGAAAAGLGPGSMFLSRYRVDRLLGRGASGEVFLARDERLGRDVALKRLAGHLRQDPGALARFERETRLAAALQHAHVVGIYDVETVGDDAILVMEYVPGGALADRLARGTMPEDEARAIARDVLDALGALHARGIVHRDVKPSNILLTRDGRAKLADFTVAREAAASETVGLAARGPVGTFAYMAPEQARGALVGPGSDLYALGATLYQVLAGKPPIAVEGLGEMEARLRVLEAPPDLPLPGVSAATNAALARALAKDPGQRFADAAAMARALGARRSSVRAEDQQAPAHADDVAGA